MLAIRAGKAWLEQSEMIVYRLSCHDSNTDIPPFSYVLLALQLQSWKEAFLRFCQENRTSKYHGLLFGSEGLADTEIRCTVIGYGGLRVPTLQGLHLQLLRPVGSKSLGVASHLDCAPFYEIFGQCNDNCKILSESC